MSICGKKICRFLTFWFSSDDIISFINSRFHKKLYIFNNIVYVVKYIQKKM
jgi:hypothetical protein